MGGFRPGQKIRNYPETFGHLLPKLFFISVFRAVCDHIRQEQPTDKVFEAFLVEPFDAVAPVYKEKLTDLFFFI